MFKILIADDEAIERTTLQEILEENLSCVSVRTAADGVAALELASVWRADLALLDIEMPGMNGIKTAAGIRKVLPSCQIVFLTAYGLFEYAQEALRLGVSDYLLKPAEDADVLAAVNKALNTLRAQNAAAQNAIKTDARTTATTPEANAAPAAPHTASGSAKDHTHTPHDKNSKLLLQVQAYLEAHFAQDISLEGLAETLDFSPFYLSKLFKQAFGTSFIEYLTDVRIAAAKEYLADPTKTTKEVGELVGYPNGNYFTKLFKKKTGYTPTEFRNLL